MVKHGTQLKERIIYAISDNFKLILCRSVSALTADFLAFAMYGRPQPKSRL